ncbi:MAG: hypothetical protein N2512_06210, partial [Armatimonadetes bacterium]|nr:hypothetical protein [Armatimonadota bacterium]
RPTPTEHGCLGFSKWARRDAHGPAVFPGPLWSPEAALLLPAGSEALGRHLFAAPEGGPAELCFTGIVVYHPWRRQG